MTTINQLSKTDTLSGSDLLVVWSTANGDTRGAALNLLLQWVEENSNLPNQQVTEYSSPSATGFSVQLVNNNAWLLLTPIATLAAGEIALPIGPKDRDIVTVSSTQTVTALTVSASQTVTGAPTTISANGFFSMRYDAVTKAWYRVG